VQPEPIGQPSLIEKKGELEEIFQMGMDGCHLGNMQQLFL
jgi:hypothetical protein